MIVTTPPVRPHNYIFGKNIILTLVRIGNKYSRETSNKENLSIPHVHIINL
jgi:hypothetical protein